MEQGQREEVELQQEEAVEEDMEVAHGPTGVVHQGEGGVTWSQMTPQTRHTCRRRHLTPRSLYIAFVL